MNYYEHHLRDYDAATAHLSWDQDLAYTRLIRWYYRKEKPIPADVAEACRQIRATSKVQRQAVEDVLREFFVLQDDGWHKDDCDEAIARYQAGEPEREAKKKNEDTRLERHRQERAELFSFINSHGEHRPWNAPIAELRLLAKSLITKDRAAEPATEPATPATAPATPATATQSPDTNHQTPLPNTSPPMPPPPMPAAPEPSATPPAPKAPRRKSSVVAEQAEEGAELVGPEQRSSQPFRRCPRRFVVTEAMVLWATKEYPILTLDELRQETRAFRNHRYPKGRLEWVPTWENWIKEASNRKTSRVRPSAGFTTRREAQVASAVPGLAKRASPLPDASPHRTVEANHARTITNFDDVTRRLPTSETDPD